LLTLGLQAAPKPETASRPADTSKSAATDAPASRPYAEIAKLAPPRDGSIRIFVIRHGQSVGNASGDSPKLTEAEKDQLSDQGKKDAAALGAAVKLMGATRLYHSPAVRASQTAEGAWRAAFGDKPPKLVKLDSVGPIALGKSPVEGAPPTSYLVSRWMKGEDPKLEGGESLADVCQRIHKGCEGIYKLAKEAKEPFAVVAHGEVLLAFLAGFDVAELRKLIVKVRVKNGGILAFDLDAAGNATCVGYFTP
jgi:broad specificity phosphatase PhoE